MICNPEERTQCNFGKEHHNDKTRIERKLQESNVMDFLGGDQSETCLFEADDVRNVAVLSFLYGTFQREFANTKM